MSLNATIRNGQFVMKNIHPSGLDYKPALNAPPGLDPDRHRIIARHIFGIDPAELRLQRLAERLERYARLDPAFVQALGADPSQPAPIHEAHR